jgi:malate permease and related proteins
MEATHQALLFPRVQPKLYLPTFALMLQSPFLLLICLAAGFATRYIPGFPADGFRKINKLIIWIPLPAITLEKISRMELAPEYLIPILASWWVFFGAMIFFGILAKVFGWDKKTWAAMSLVCGLGNTSFVGFPVIRLLYGEEGIRYAIFVDQPGTFLMLATGGVALAAYGATGKFSGKAIGSRLLQFPPFLCFVAAIVLPSAWLDTPVPAGGEDIGAWLSQIGLLLNPLAFLSIGMQFRFSAEGITLKPYAAGLMYKLMLAPLTVWLLFQIMQWEGLMYDITVLELAMPPMVTASIIAIEHDLRPRMSAAWINFGIPISALSLWIWTLILG